MSHHLIEKLNQSAKEQKRFAFLELLLIWEGKVTAKQLAHQFEISEKLAELVIHQYLELYPENLAFNGAENGYVTKTKMVPQFTEGTLQDYVMQVANGQQVTQLAMPSRHVEPELVRPILQAIREERRLKIHYASVQHPNFRERVIQPHNLVFDGMRWHVRAYCESNEAFRDFVISRFDPNQLSEVLDHADHFDLEDESWNTELSVEIMPDPRLDSARQTLIALDYDMQTTAQGFRKTIPVRAAMLMYLIQRLGLQNKDARPEAQQIVLTDGCEQRLSAYLS